MPLPMPLLHFVMGLVRFTGDIMLLGHKKFTLGNEVQYTVDYSKKGHLDAYTLFPIEPLRDGDSIVSATVNASASDVTVGSPAVVEGHKVVFLLGGGSLNELFTVAVSITTNTTETFVDTISFHVVSP